MYWLLFFLMLSGGWLLYPKKIQELQTEIPFEQFYILNDEEPEESEDLKKLEVVEETTPEGTVRMKYDDGIFLYWSNRPIQYKYLETLARKYVMVYKCKENYIQYDEKVIVLPKKEKEKEKEKSSVFASFKTYNKKRKQNDISNKKTNQYTWKGKISEYERAVPSVIKPIRYSDFKKM